jgi:mono/diheme cytochrome c family protein
MRQRSTVRLTVRTRLRAVVVLLGLLLVAPAWVWWLNIRGEEQLPAQQAEPALSPEQIERGAYLARAGNCGGCHTDRGGPAFAGGKGIPTPFGTIYASNLTPDPKTGIGSWTAAHFWRAVHHGRSKDGRLLYPAFPYPSFTLINRDDSDALYAYLHTLPPAVQPNQPPSLRFPYNQQAALAVWRALFFSPRTFERQAEQSDAWNRGAYLVRGLGHCDACHAQRNIFGATRAAIELSGGLIPNQHWYAPSLADSGEAGVADWALEEVMRLLGRGTSRRGSAMGPMAEVVFRSTQYLSDDDLRAMAIYLRSLPQRTPAAPRERTAAPEALELGHRIYAQECARCHGEEGEGQGPYPALVHHRTVTMGPHTNLVRVIVSGGFPASTAGNPRPYGMPSLLLDDDEIAAVASYVRSAWGHRGPAVTALDVRDLR